MNFNQTNNNKGKSDVNTTAIQFRNREGVYPSALVIGYWSSLISLRIHPPLDKSQQNGENFFNWDKGPNTAITLEKSIVLADLIETVIVPALKEGTTKFRGVQVGDNGLVGVGTELEGGVTPSAYFVIYKKLDDTTKKPSEYLKYYFKTSYVVNDYDPESGSFYVTQNIHSELQTFLKILKVACIGLSNATVHADRHVNKFFRDKFMGRIEEIAIEMGLPSGKTYTKGGNSGVFTSAPKSDSRVESPYEAPIKTLENIEDIESFM